MFKFQKVRGPEQVGDALSMLEETANRLESMVEMAQKEKSRLHQLVGNVNERVDQIKQSAAGFDGVVGKIDSFQSKFREIEKEIQDIQKQTAGLSELKKESAVLFDQYKQLKSSIESTTKELKGQADLAKQLEPFSAKVGEIQSKVMPQVETIYQKQGELIDGYNSFADRLQKAESKLKGLVSLSDEFKKTSEGVARESAKLSSWMEATDSMSSRLDQATEAFEATRQKIDNLHELAEYIEGKTKSLKKQKELLKKAHIESGRANGLFWEIKSKLNELEHDAEKIRQMEIRTGDFDHTLKRLENRFEQINAFSKKVDQLMADYAKLDEYAMQLHEHRKSLSVIEQLSGQIAQYIETAREQRNLLAEAEKRIAQFIKRSEESQNQSRTVIGRMTEVAQNAEKFLQKAPDIGKTLTEIESMRKRSQALENKLMEAMTAANEIKKQTEQAVEIKKSIDQFNSDIDKKISLQKKEMSQLSGTITELRNGLEIIQANWERVPELTNKLDEIGRVQGNLDRTYKSVIQKEQVVESLKTLMEQNNAAFKEFEKTSAEIHNKAAATLEIKSELDNIDYKVKSLFNASQQLPVLGERIEKTENEMSALTEHYQELNKNVSDWKTQADDMKTEHVRISKTQENLRANVKEVTGLFTSLSELRNEAQNEAARLDNFFQQTEQKVKDLEEINKRSVNESGSHIEKLDEIRESMQAISEGQQNLDTRFEGIEAESARLMDFVTAINEKQKEISALERQTATISGKLAEADRIKEQVEYFEKAIEKLDAEMKNIGAGMKNVEKVAKDFDGYGTKMAEFEKKIAAVAVKTKIIDKLKKDLNQASLMADELKARQNGLKEEKDLIDKAITAAAKLEELVYRAEHIKEKAK